MQDQTVELGSVETRMGKKTIELHHISKSYGEKEDTGGFQLYCPEKPAPRHHRTQRMRKIHADQDDRRSGRAGYAGHIEIGETIKIGYFAQEEQHMDDSQRVIDYVKDIAEYITTTDGKISASALLERFLFTPDMQYAPIGKLSGGEKRRLIPAGRPRGERQCAFV